MTSQPHIFLSFCLHINFINLRLHSNSAMTTTCTAFYDVPEEVDGNFLAHSVLSFVPRKEKLLSDPVSFVWRNMFYSVLSAQKTTQWMEGRETGQTLEMVGIVFLLFFRLSLPSIWMFYEEPRVLCKCECGWAKHFCSRKEGIRAHKRFHSFAVNVEPFPLPFALDVERNPLVKLYKTSCSLLLPFFTFISSTLSRFLFNLISLCLPTGMVKSRKFFLISIRHLLLS